MTTGIKLGDPYGQRRSRLVARILLGLGVLVALLAALGTYLYAGAARTATPTDIPTVDVLVAARDIDARSAIGANDVKVIQLPRDAAPASALRDANAASGMVTTVPLAANEPVLPTKIAQPGAGGHIAVLPPGQVVTNAPAFRAMALNIPDSNAAGGLIVAGDHVDILYTLAVVEPTRSDFVGRIVIQDVPVLAKTITVYTLRVDAAVAERIAALQASGGSLHLLLRAPGDARPAGTAGASFTSEVQRILRP
ncbi:MAG TPA: Flp pilus assembly protein CpaB [Candidatus Limnocylindria bacterium]|nr:Flp pilus assembly protein CpaB [Candidatus Limnocylindria bacterium]